MRKAFSILYLAIFGLSCALWVVIFVKWESLLDLPEWFMWLPASSLGLLAIAGIVLSSLNLSQKKQVGLSWVCLIMNILGIATSVQVYALFRSSSI